MSSSSSTNNDDNGGDDDIQQQQQQQLILQHDKNVSLYLERIDPQTCTSGVYMLKSKRTNTTTTTTTTHFIFKPRDEESKVEIEGIENGDGYKKEVAAFLLDQLSNGFSNVPRTAIAHAKVNQNTNAFSILPPQPLPSTSSSSTSLVPLDYKVGSVQEYVENDGSCEDRGWSEYDVQQVQNIAVLDIRIFNADRHLGNILVASDNKQLIPIDHALSLPSIKDLPYLYWGWSTWKQAKLPFTNKSKAYIRSLKPLTDVMVLSKLGIRHESILSNIVGNILLKAFVAANKGPADIAKFVIKKEFGEFITKSLDLSNGGEDYIEFGLQFASLLSDHLNIFLSHRLLRMKNDTPPTSPSRQSQQLQKHSLYRSSSA